MTNDEYNEKITTINKKLAQISERTYQMAQVHSAHSNNPEFVSLMNEFDNLVKCSNELTEKILKLLIE